MARRAARFTATALTLIALTSCGTDTGPKSAGATGGKAAAGTDELRPGDTVPVEAFYSRMKSAMLKARTHEMRTVRQPSVAGVADRTQVRMRDDGGDLDVLSIERDTAFRVVDGSVYVSQLSRAPREWTAFRVGAKDPTSVARVAAQKAAPGPPWFADGELDAVEGGKVTFLGRDSDGAHYRHSWDVSKKTKATNAAIEAQLRRSGLDRSDLAEALRRTQDDESAAGTIVTDLWLDRRGRPAKMSHIGPKSPYGGTPVSTTTYSGWGKGVRIEAPPVQQQVAPDPE